MFRLPLVFFLYSLFAGTALWPVAILQFPADLYSGAEYTGTNPPQAKTGTTHWEDVGYSRIRIERNDSPTLVSSTWVKSRGSAFTFKFLNQSSPFQHKVALSFIQYYSNSDATGALGIRLSQYLDFGGSANAADLTFDINTAWNSVDVWFAPYLGQWQQMTIKLDPRAPLIKSNLAGLVAGTEIQEGTNWIRPDSADYNGYLNFAILKNNARLRVYANDDENQSGVPGSGIWYVKGDFDNIADAVNGIDMMKYCETLPSQTGLIRLADAHYTSDPRALCTTTTAVPANGIARIGTADANLEAWYSLNWGNKSGSTFQQQGSYADGQHAAALWVRDLAGHEIVSFHLFRTDRYAPCDNATSAHSCALTFTDNLGSALPGNATNSGNIRAKIFLQEGSNSGVKSDGSVNNIKLLVARQSEGGTSALTWVTSAGLQTNWTVADNNARDKTCEEIIGNPTGPVWTNPFPFYEGNYNTAATGDNTMEIPVNISALAEGSYWFFVCAKDIAGNWSLIYDPANSTAEPNNPLRTSSLTNLSAFNSSDYPDYNYLSTDTARVIAGALVPSLRKRLLLDRSTPDEASPPVGESCSSDPCIVRRLLSPQPAFFVGGESDMRIAYSPVGYTNSNQITVGVKLPPDNSGIKTLYWDSTPGSPTPVNAVARTAATVTDCAPVLAANSAAAGWVDFCFVADGNSGDTMFVWLEDNAGNNNNPAGRASRLMFIDRNPPAAAVNLLVTPNPTTSTTPTLTFNTIADTSGIKEHKICYWQYFSGFTQSDLQALHNSSAGACPTSSQLLGRTVNSNVVTHSGADGVTQIFVVPGASPISAGRWDFAVYSTDNAGNISSPSTIYPVYLSDGNSRLDFTNASDDYKAGGVSPRVGSSGLFTFKIRFTDFQDKSPSVAAQVWIDLDGNGSYSTSEQFGMTRNNDGTSLGNNSFFDGEDYSFQRKIEYVEATGGLIKYKFYFQTDSSTAINGGNSAGDPTADNTFLLDPYDVFSFTGMMQVRNNFVRPGSTLDPVILLKPPRQKDGVVRVAVYDQQGRLVTTLVDNKPWSSLDRTVTWKVRNSSLASGVYNVVYLYDEQSEFRKVVVVR